MATFTVTAPHVFTGDDELRPGWVRWSADRIEQVGRGAPPTSPDLVLDDGILAPGMIDAQVNGGFGIDLGHAAPQEWSPVLRALATTGVTSILATVITAPLDDLVAVLHRYRGLASALAAVPGASRVLGLHLEGPFLSPQQAGAHRPAWLRTPHPADLDVLLDAGGDVLRQLTLAPELPGGLDAVRRCVAAGVRVSIGHSDANAATVRAAADAGATGITHLFNAQRGFHHREPGVVGVALTDDRFTCGLIVDGHHVDPVAVRLAFACAGNRVMLVSDAVAALGAPPGRYLLGGQPIVVSAEGPARREDGTLAGSVGRLDDAVALAVSAGVDLRAAVEAVTRVPAEALGRTDLGRLAPGCRADLVWLAPTPLSAHPYPSPHPHLRTRATWLRGTRVPPAPSGATLSGAPDP